MPLAHMYDDFYGFREPPFRLTPDPRFLYLSRQHGEALAHLLVGVREGGGIVVITGEIGAGKTTVLRTMLAELGPETRCAYIFNPPLSELELLRAIASELDLPSDLPSRKDLMDRLNSYLLEEKSSGHRIVVIIDEAQSLPPAVLEQLRLLSNLETPTDKLLQIVLVGQPQLRDLLERPELAQLNQRVTLRWHLEALQADETAGYVRHRLSVAGGDSSQVRFTRRSLRRVHRLTGGIPRRINILCHRSLLVGYTRDRRRIDGRTVHRAAREISPRRRRRAWRYAAGGAALAAIALTLALALEPAPPKPREIQRPGGLATVSVRLPPVPPGPLPATAALAPLWRLPPAQAGRHALAELAATWGLAPPRSLGKRPRPAAFARRHGLHYLRLTAGTLPLIATLDLPAILELVPPAEPQARWVLLRRMHEGTCLLALPGGETTVPCRAVAARWLGDAHIFWRDHLSLDASVRAGDSGASVEQLRALLAESGVAGAGSGPHFGAGLDAAVRSFQAQNGLAPDGIVGPLTKIVLYRRAGSYAGPHLAGRAGDQPPRRAASVSER